MRCATARRPTAAAAATWRSSARRGISTDPSWRGSVTPADVFAKIRNGVPGTAMPAWRALGDQTVWDLTAFVLSVGRRKSGN